MSGINTATLSGPALDWIIGSAIRSREFSIEFRPKTLEVLARSTCTPKPFAFTPSSNVEQGLAIIQSKGIEVGPGPDGYIGALRKVVAATYGSIVYLPEALNLAMGHPAY